MSGYYDYNQYYSQYYQQPQQHAQDQKKSWSAHIPHFSPALWLVLVLFLLFALISAAAEGCTIFSMPAFIAGVSVDSSTYDF